MRIGGTREVHLTIIVISYDNGKTQTNYWGVKMSLSTTTKSDKFMHKKSRILNTLPNGVTHLIMPLIDVKIRLNHAENIMDFEDPT